MDAVELAVEVGPIGFVLEVPDAQVRSELRRRHEGFQGCGGGPRVKVRTREGPLDLASVRHQPRWPRAAITGGGLEAWVDWHARCGEVVAPRDFAAHLTGSLLALATSAWALEHDGVLLHAGGLIRRGLAWVFAGPSGSGKSTVCRLSAGWAQELSDDHILVLPGTKGYTCYSVPLWSGDVACRQPGEPFALGALLLLQKADRHRLKPLSRAEATARLLCLPVGLEDAQPAAKLLDTCADLVVHVPCYELEFGLDGSFWELLDDQLG